MDLVILDTKQLKNPMDSYSFTTQKKFNHTRDFNDNTLVGNSPFLVENKTGNIVVFGTNQSTAHYIQEYEAGRLSNTQGLNSSLK
ncbi:hypothetical protein [Chryseobacterium indologenes]|uniref:hypothetical protein n=1 Tax=Chryseobacterium indologenes TaxID=253 RepID=UPI001BCFA1EF|nr:hypothetical protein [Chryseobacterium indologenes]